MKWLINVLALLEALLCMTNSFLLIGQGPLIGG